MELRVKPLCAFGGCAHSIGDFTTSVVVKQLEKLLEHVVLISHEVVYFRILVLGEHIGKVKERDLRESCRVDGVDLDTP